MADRDGGAGSAAAEGLRRVRGLQVAANRAEMARVRVAVGLFQQFSADHLARRAADRHHTMTPLAELVTEVQPMTGQTVTRIRGEVEQVLLVDRHLPWLAGLLDAGRVDLYRVRPVTDAVREDLADHPEAVGRFSELMEAWFGKHLACSPGLVNQTVTQVRNRVHYVVTRLLAAQVDERFKRRHRQRCVRTAETGDGMAELTIDTDTVSVRLASAHLDLLARDARRRGDQRTLEQLRADLAVDLLTGRHTTPGADDDSEDSSDRAGDRREVGRWARPVVNITVPIQTLMGLADEPGQMGEQTLPAGLVRAVAARPGSTWHRLLTDPRRRGVELSTTSYRPTGPIVREVVATQPTCFAPTCSRPAAECELDHQVPWPQGETSTGNIGPGCPRHHVSKHGPGAGLRRGSDGVLRYTLRSGLTHLVAPAEVPVGEDAEAWARWEELVEIQPTVAELTAALDELRGWRQHRDRQLADQATETDRLEADYRASYPDASDEDIAHWVHGDEPGPGTDPTYHPPPILTRARFTYDHAPEDDLSALVS